MTDSSIPRFFEKDRKERLDIVKKFSGLSNEDIEILEKSTGGITFDEADKMVENAIGTFALPLGIATNFQVNGRDYLVPMVIEEPSVVAAASKGAKMTRAHGGFKAQASDAISIGQIQVVNVDVKSAITKIQQSSKEILELANSKSKTLPKIGKEQRKLHVEKLLQSQAQCLL